MRIWHYRHLLCVVGCHAASHSGECFDVGRHVAAQGGALLQQRVSAGRAEAELSAGAAQHPPAASAQESGQQEPDAADEPDPHYTLHGCQCHHYWKQEVDGKLNTYEACQDVPSDHAKDWAWCKVMDDCEKPAGKDEDGTMWDYCSLDKEVSHLRTVHGCHCNPHFEWNNTVWDSCSKTSQGPKWCYVFESDQLCPESLRTEHHGQHWDYCYTLADTSPFLTLNGCHCMPKYHIGDQEYEGCATFVLQGETIQGCVILEDGEACNAKYSLDGSAHAVDLCTVRSDDANGSIATLDTAFHEKCHCHSEWEWQGKQYGGCSQTPDKESKWCFIIEDARECPEEDGVAQSGLSTQRWRWCGTSPNDKPPSETPQQGDLVTILPGQFDHGCDHYMNRTGKIIQFVNDAGTNTSDLYFSVESFLRDDGALCRFNGGDVKVTKKKARLPEVGDLVKVLPGRLDNGCSTWRGKSGIVEKFLPNDGDPYYLIKGFTRDDSFRCRFRYDVLEVLPPADEEAKQAPREIWKIVPIIVPVQDDPREVQDGQLGEKAASDGELEEAPGH